MVRTAARVVLGAMLLGAAVGCWSARRATLPLPPPSAAVSLATAPPATATARPAGATQPPPTQPPTPTAILEGRLPAEVARVSLGLPNGDAYGPQALAFDEAGRAVVLAYHHGRPEATASALVVIGRASCRERV